MQRIIQKAIELVGPSVLAAALLLPLMATAPAAAAPLQPAGTCFVSNVGTPSTTRPCQGYIPDGSVDSDGNPVDSSQCYEVAGTTSTSTITHVSCDDTTIGGSAQAGTFGTGCTSISNCDLIKNYIQPLVNVLAALVGVAVVVSVIVGGIQYSSSGGDPQKATAARSRITNAIIALIVFVFLYALLNFLIPGGL